MGILLVVMAVTILLVMIAVTITLVMMAVTITLVMTTATIMLTLVTMTTTTMMTRMTTKPKWHTARFIGCDGKFSEFVSSQQGKIIKITFLDLVSYCSQRAPCL